MSNSELCTTGECQELFGWMVRQLGIQDNPENRKDWFRSFKPLTSTELRKGKSGLLHQRNSDFPPKIPEFLRLSGYAPPRTIPRISSQTPIFQVDEKGREIWEGEFEKPRKWPGQEAVMEARRRAALLMRGFIGDVGTPLYKINKMLKSQGIPTYPSQRAWDDAVEAKKTESGNA